MSTMGGGIPPSLTTIDALLSLAEFVSSPDMIARVKELREAEAAALEAHKAALETQGAVLDLQDKHAEAVRLHNLEIAQLIKDKAELEKAQDLHKRKIAKMREAENLR